MAINIPIVSEFDGKGIKKAIAQFKQLETTGQKAQFALKKAALPATAALAGLAAAAGPAISAASDLGENLSKVNVIFGEGAAEVEKFAASAAKSMGQSKNAVLTAAGTFGTFGKAAGLSGRDLAGFSNDFTALASDLASFNNTTPEQAVQAIGAALRGESEPLRQYGVLLNDAALKAAALELGIYDGSGALTDQQKILAAQKVIFEQTTDAQGDFARTSDGLANSQRTLTAQMENLQVSIGQALLPVVEAILPLVQSFAAWAADNPQTFLAIAGAIGAVAAAIVVTNIAMALNPFALIAAGIALLVVALVTAYNKFEWFRDGIKAIVNTVIGFFAGMVNAAIGAVNAIISAYNSIPLLPDIPKAPTMPVPQLGAAGPASSPSRTRAIPRMAEGGIVSSPTLAMIGEAGPEAVVPLDRLNNGGGITINVTGGLPQAPRSVKASLTHCAPTRVPLGRCNYRWPDARRSGC
jgi:hypothetical protein